MTQNLTYLASAELAAITSVLGKLPTLAEYQEYAQKIDTMSAEVCRYLSFDQMDDFVKAAEGAKPSTQAAASA